MTATTRLLARAAAWLRHRHGAGSSAAAQARRLRTPAVRLAELLGLDTRRGQAAARWAAGAEGERRTARLLAPLSGDGWTLLHDRALPGSNANADTVAVSPRGVVFVLDSKLWSSRWRVRAVGGRLHHGDRDVTERLRGLRHEAQAVGRILGTPVVPVVLMHGAPVDGGELAVDGIRIVPADRARAILRRLARALAPAPSAPADVARIARQRLKPYR
jgi:hypothetical protein